MDGVFFIVYPSHLPNTRVLRIQLSTLLPFFPVHGMWLLTLQHKWKNPSNMVTNALIVISGFAEGEQPHAMHWKKGE